MNQLQGASKKESNSGGEAGGKAKSFVVRKMVPDDKSATLTKKKVSATRNIIFVALIK